MTTQSTQTVPTEVRLFPRDFPIFPIAALIVEDEPLIAFDLGDVLTSRGVNEIGYAKNLAEATTALSERRWGVVILDISSGTLDDVSHLARSLRDSGVPFIFCSAQPYPPLGFETVPLVPKPYTPAEIFAALIMAGVAEKAFTDRPSPDTDSDAAMRNLVHLLGRDKSAP